MHPPQDQERWTEALIDRAARTAFPDWTPTPDDWTSLHTTFPGGHPVTEVAVYRGHDRIHYRAYSGDELEPFWEQVINASTQP